jgi:hypothetical protein
MSVVHTYKIYSVQPCVVAAHPPMKQKFRVQIPSGCEVFWQNRAKLFVTLTSYALFAFNWELRNCLKHVFRSFWQDIFVRTFLTEQGGDASVRRSLFLPSQLQLQFMYIDSQTLTSSPMVETSNDSSRRSSTQFFAEKIDQNCVT